MRFLKEFIIVFIILVFVFGVEFITIKITQSSFDEITVALEEIENNLEDDNINIKLNELDSKWNEKENILSCYTEHDELEKVSENIVNMKSNIENKENEEANENIAEIKFRIEHIKDKQKLSWKNIF